jgi:hypothetical protein
MSDYFINNNFIFEINKYLNSLYLERDTEDVKEIIIIFKYNLQLYL